MVNQLLTEMDGLQARKQVFIMGATNRPGKVFLINTVDTSLTLEGKILVNFKLLNKAIKV